MKQVSALMFLVMLHYCMLIKRMRLPIRLKEQTKLFEKWNSYIKMGS